jgi:hypothetical protein
MEQDRHSPNVPEQQRDGQWEARDGAGRDQPSAPERRSGEGTTQEGAPREGAPREGATQGGTPSEGATQEGAPREGATRDYQERLRDLDRAGTIDEPSDRRAGGAGRDAAEGRDEGESREEGESRDEGDARSVRDLLRERGVRKQHGIALGLAASSIGMLAATRAGGPGGAGGDVAEVALADAFMPPEQVTEEKGVTWDLHVSEHERIDFFVEFLMGRNYDKTRTWLERIGKYGPMIQNELSERGMPQDLLYLAMIESGLNPTAYSKAHASGMWQFISETGQRYGLEVSRYVDERRDPVKSTAAGLTYLQEMYERFDSWYLSSAGYNTGENRVGRLMRERTGSERGTDEGYWDIWDRLPRETRDYVPLMIAMGHIAKEPAKYGFHDLQYEAPLTFEEVVVPGGTRMADVARAAGVSTAVIEDLNPHYLRGQTPPNRSMAVRVPVGQQQQVAMALSGQPVAAPVFGE